jgi:hypothetical protein
MAVNKLTLGDNLEIPKGMEADSVDLIYLDPLFSVTATMWASRGNWPCCDIAKIMAE